MSLLAPSYLKTQRSKRDDTRESYTTAIVLRSDVANGYANIDRCRMRCVQRRWDIWRISRVLV